MQTFLEILDVTLGVIVIFGFALVLLHAREIVEAGADIIEQLPDLWDRWWKKITKKE